MDQPAVQRVCPNCARISYESGKRCPYCGSGFRRRSNLGAIAAMLTVWAAVVLGGVAVMLTIAGREAEDTLDREVERVERELDRDFSGIQDDVREELDRRLPPP